MHSTARLDGAQRVLVTGGAGTDRVDHRRPAPRRGRRRGRVLDNLVRGRMANLAPAHRQRPVTAGRGRPPRPAPGARRHRGHRPRVPPGGDPHHAVRRGAAARARGPGRRHVQRARGGGRGRGRQGRRRLVGLGLRPGRGVPDHRAATTLQQRHVLRRGEVFNEGCCAASTRCTGSTTWRCATSTCTARGWTSTALYTEVLVRWMERIAERPAAADLRRRRADDGLRLHRRHRAGQPPRRAERRHRRGLQRRQRRRRRASTGWPRPSCAVMDSDLERRARPGARGQRRDPASRRHGRGAATPRLHRRDRPARGPAARWSSWWQRTSAPPVDAGEERRHDDGQRHEAVARARRRPRPPPTRSSRPAGSPRDPRSPSSSRPSPPRQARSTASPSSLHDRAAPRAPRRSASGPATTSSSRRSRSSPPRTRPRYVGATPVFADVDLATGNLTRRDRRRRCCTPRTRPSSLVHQGGVPADIDAIRDLCDPLGHRGRRGRRLRGRVAATAAARSARRSSTRRAGRSTRARSSPPARAACSLTDRSTGPSAPRACASTA